MRGREHPQKCMDLEHSFGQYPMQPQCVNRVVFGSLNSPSLDHCAFSFLRFSAAPGRGSMRQRPLVMADGLLAFTGLTVSICKTLMSVTRIRKSFDVQLEDPNCIVGFLLLPESVAESLQLRPLKVVAFRFGFLQFMILPEGNLNVLLSRVRRRVSPIDTLEANACALDNIS